MTKQQAQDAMRLIRNQLDKYPIDGDSVATDTTDIDNAYTIVYELWQQIEESN